jgi:RND superfamily putative drug exporter
VGTDSSYGYETPNRRCHYFLVNLGVMAAPISNIKFSQGDSRMLPASNKAAIATALQAERFPGQTGNPN